MVAAVDMKKLAGTAGPSITLVVALVMLFVSLAAFLLASSLWSRLQETQDQLEETRGQLQQMQAAKNQQQKTGKGSGGQPGAVDKSQPQNNTNDRLQDKTPTWQGQPQQQAMILRMQADGGPSLPYLLLLLSLGLAVLGSLALVVISGLTLLFGGSRSGRSGAAGADISAPSQTESQTESSNFGDVSPVEDGRWMKLVEECVEVVDELDEHMGDFDAPRREMAGHVILRLEEILERSGVEVISDEAIFDRARHKPHADHAATDNGAAVSKTLSPGFVVGSRVLRRARVRLE